jgi:hypothetical protein
MNLKEYMDKCKKRLSGGLQHDMEQCAMDAFKKLDLIALRWTLQSLSEPSELLEPFIAAIPNFLGPPSLASETTVPLHDLLYRDDPGLGHRIGHLLETQMHMPIACIDSLWHITLWHNTIDVWEWATAFGEVTAKSLNRLKGSHNPVIALTAHCTAALAVRVLLKDLQRMFEPAQGINFGIPKLRKVLHPLMDADQAVLEPLTPEDLIRDGHVLNMASILTSAIPLIARVDETHANVLWDTLKMLCSDLDARPASVGAQTALVRAWKAYKGEPRAWTPALGGIPYQSPTTSAAAAEKATAPVVATTPAPAAAATALEAVVAEIPASIRDIGGE